MSFRPAVLKALPDQELRWLGNFMIPGLIDGEHSFTIEPRAGGGVRFRQAARFPDC